MQSDKDFLKDYANRHKRKKKRFSFTDPLPESAIRRMVEYFKEEE